MIPWNPSFLKWPSFRHQGPAFKVIHLVNFIYQRYNFDFLPPICPLGFFIPSAILLIYFCVLSYLFYLFVFLLINSTVYAYISVISYCLTIIYGSHSNKTPLVSNLPYDSLFYRIFNRVFRSYYYYDHHYSYTIHINVASH